jgi:hypothetical protein
VAADDDHRQVPHCGQLAQKIPAASMLGFDFEQHNIDYLGGDVAAGLVQAAGTQHTMAVGLQGCSKR